jgi:hypothetical protein
MELDSCCVLFDTKDIVFAFYENKSPKGSWIRSDSIGKFLVLVVGKILNMVLRKT